MSDQPTLTDSQIRRAFHTVVGGPARTADVAVIQMMGSTVDVMAEYIWDHWFGEPDTPTVEEVEEAIRAEVAKEQTETDQA